MQDSILWIGTGNGLIKYNTKSETLQYLTHINNINTSHIKDIAVSKDGSVWFMVDGFTLLKFDGKNWIHYITGEDDLPTGTITKIETDSNNNLFIILDDRLMRFDGKSWFCFPRTGLRFGKEFRINDIVVNKDLIWLCTTQHLLAYHNGNWSKLKFPVKRYYNYNRNIYLSNNHTGTLLLFLFNKIYKVNFEDNITLELIEELNGYLNCFAFDNEGNLRLLTRSTTISSLTGDSFHQRDIITYKIDGDKLILLETMPDIIKGERDIHQIELDNNGFFWFHNRSIFYRLSNTKLKRIMLWELLKPPNEARGGTYGDTMNPNYPDSGDLFIKGYGDFTDQQEEGYWTYTNSNNRIMMEGEYEEGKRLGTWKKYYSNGSIHEEIEYKDGFRDGYFVHYFKNGEKWNEGNYSKGKKTGEWKTFFDNGNIREISEFKNDVINGRFITYDYKISGQKIKQGEKVNDKINGILHQYYKNGTYGEKEFVNGDGVGAWEYFNSDGNPIYSTKFPTALKQPNELNENGNKQGLWITFMFSNFEQCLLAEDASYYRIAEYEDGVPQGIVRDYYRDGKLQFEGKLISEFPSVYDETIRIYWASGSLKKEEVYKNGVLIDHYDIKKIQPFSLLQVIERQEEPLIFNPVSTENWRLKSCKYLMNKIESEEKCVPVKSSESTEWQEGKISTIGREAMFILQGFIDGKYPPTECSVTDFNPKVKYYKKWWKKYQKNMEKK
jgi:antitoxin component YwqK of YwqJK toxin-antitoxin module